MQKSVGTLEPPFRFHSAKAGSPYFFKGCCLVCWHHRFYAGNHVTQTSEFVRLNHSTISNPDFSYTRVFSVIHFLLHLLYMAPVFFFSTFSSSYAAPVGRDCSMATLISSCTPCRAPRSVLARIFLCKDDGFL